jgi:hypothetical protein
MNPNEFEQFNNRLTDKVVKVSLPVSATFKLEQFQKVQAEILGRLGCPACTSGWDIRYDIQRQFLVDENLRIRELG